MADAYFKGVTIDDVLHEVFEAVLTDGKAIMPTKGAATELCGVLLEITNPRARLSRTETRGKPFSCLGELCWYLAGSDQLDFIAYYIPDYERYADGDSIFGAYGPRLFDRGGMNQVANVISILTAKPDSRQAVIQIFDATDTIEKHNDIPCTCTLQLLLRNGNLHLFTSMRSNDAYLGMPHDIFAFTMLQEMVARSLSVEIGTYKHAVGSLHIYDDQREQAKKYLQEGWQSTATLMPAMPEGAPWDAIKSLLEAESALRLASPVADTSPRLDPYWQDLVRLLRILRCSKDGDAEGIETLRDEMHSDVYRPFIERKLNDTKAKRTP